MPMLRHAHPCINYEPERKDCHVISDRTPKHRYVHCAARYTCRTWSLEKHFIQSNHNILGSVHI